MKNVSSLIMAGCVACLTLISLPAQVANEGLANKIMAARKANAALLKQYSWNCRTEITDDGKVKDIRIDSVSCGPDGKLQRTILNDQGAPLPSGFLRKRIAEKEREKVEKYLKGLTDLLDQYTLPSAGKILDFVSQAQIGAPNANGTLQLSGSGVVIPDDSFTLSIDAASRQTRKVQINTFFDGDMVEVTATFKTLSTGLTHLQFANVQVAAKGLSVQIHNYDYNQNN